MKGRLSSLCNGSTAGHFSDAMLTLTMKCLFTITTSYLLNHNDIHIDKMHQSNVWNFAFDLGHFLKPKVW